MGKGQRPLESSTSGSIMATPKQDQVSKEQRGVDRKGKGKAVQSGEEAADDELMASLKRHDASFTALLSLIPAHLYLAPQDDAELDSDGNTDQHQANHTGSKRGKEAAEAIPDRKTLAREAKRAKFDPDNQKSALQIQQDRDARQEARRQKDEEMNDFSFDMDAGSIHAGDTDEDDEDEDDDGASYETLPTSTKGSEELGPEKAPALDSPNSAMAAQLGVFDLRARLQAKIQGLQAQRKATQSRDGLRGNAGVGEDDESTASTKDELLEERRKRRGDMRDKRRKAAKERKRAEREQTSGSSKGNSGNDRKGGAHAPGLLVAPARTQAGSAKAAHNLGGGGSNDMSFSAMKFEGETTKKNKFALPSDPKAALAVLEARKRKDQVHQAKREARAAADETATGGEQSQSHAERAKWSKAEAAAQGVKIREDETLLKKAVKRKEKQKSQSTKEWKKRGRDLDSQQIARQKKRTDNIAARKERKTKGAKGGKSSSGSSFKGKTLGSHKGKGGPSSGRSDKKARPGFEGKRRSMGKAGAGGGKRGGR